MHVLPKNLNKKKINTLFLLTSVYNLKHLYRLNYFFVTCDESSNYFDACVENNVL